MLLEAILSVVIVSICLTFIAQSLLTNFRTGIRFQEMTRSLIVMENQLSLLFATNNSTEDFDTYPQALEKPYDRFSSSASTENINDHLKKVDIKLNWPAGRTPGQLDLTTIIFTHDEN